MQNKVLDFIRRYSMIEPGDTVICAVSGGADSIALLWALYLLRDKLRICVEAAHFNHNLRGAESDRDERFVRDFCQRYDITLHVGSEVVSAGKKGLEASARQARYRFFQGLSGKIATAHTADDNAETVLMHMLRGTGLKGLGGITPVNGSLIRPMLAVTREEVLAFLKAYSLTFVQDSSNDTDLFLRNRIRHHIMPGFTRENPSFARTVSDMALRLRFDEELLSRQAKDSVTKEVSALRKLEMPLRSRVLAMLLEAFGVREPSAAHIELLNAVVASDMPSARADFPGGIQIGKSGGVLKKLGETHCFCIAIQEGSAVKIPELGLRVHCGKGNEAKEISFVPAGNVVVRSRNAGDTMRLNGGTKSLKKLYIDRKIPASLRMQIPVVADDAGVIGVYGIGVNLDRLARTPDCLCVWFEEI